MDVQLMKVEMKRLKRIDADALITRMQRIQDFKNKMLRMKEESYLKTSGSEFTHGFFNKRNNS